jgi:ADP-ribosyl-[dinitrogen reductase] hydrolase
MDEISIDSRLRGGVEGALIGDALGVPVEFQARSARKADPVTGMRAYGTHRQPAGTWSDDGALLLCSIESLIQGDAPQFDPEDMGQRFVRWYDQALWTATGHVFDIGGATARALSRIASGVPALEAGGRSSMDNGNGSLMRILPVALAARTLSPEQRRSWLEQASAITHGHDRSCMACAFYAELIRAICHGDAKEQALNQARQAFSAAYADHEDYPLFQYLMETDVTQLPEPVIPSGGYVMETLVASVWCWLTTDTYADAVLRAVNLGSDTDTTGCVTGGLAGCFYGVTALPKDWREALPRRQELDQLVGRLCARWGGNEHRAPF